MAKQKTSRKAFATTAAAVMAATAVTPVASFAASTTSFPDVPAGEYADAINNLVGKGIINGFDDGTFKPNNPVTREQAAKILATALKLDTTGTENYPDVSPDNWSYKYIVAVTKAGIFGGDENGNFKPFDNLTRQQAAKIIVEAFDFTGSSELTFGDKANIQSWAVPYVKTAVANGILKGDDQGNFNPNANIKRGDFALMIQRALNAVAAPQVESVSAINANTISVTFEGIEEPVEIELEEALVHGQTEVTFVYEEVEYTAELTEAYVDPEVEAEEKLAAAITAAEEAIAALPTVEEVAIEDAQAVADAKALVEAVKALDAEAVVEGEEVIAELEAKIEELEAEQAEQEKAAAIKDAIDKINAIGKPATLTLEDEAKVVAARTAVNAAKELGAVDADIVNLDHLNAAETQINTLKEALNEKETAIQEANVALTNLPLEVTLEDKEQVEEARELVNKALELGAEENDFVNLWKLTDAEAKIAELEEEAAEAEAVQAVIDAIDALPEEITLEDAEAVADARAAYDALTEEQQELVTNVDVLEAAEAKIAELEEEAAKELKVESVSAITTTGVEVTVEASEEDREETINVVDPEGNTVEVKPTLIPAGQTKVTFDFAKAYEKLPLGTFKVAGKEFDTAAVAAVEAVKEAANENNVIKLWNALQSPYFEGALEENIDVYEAAINQAVKDNKLNTVADVNKLISDVNNKEASDEAEAAVVKSVIAVVEANGNHLQVYNVLNKNFDRVNAEWVAKYLEEAVILADNTEQSPSTQTLGSLKESTNAFGKAQGVTIEAIQGAIDAANAKQVAAAYDKAFKSLKSTDVTDARALANEYLTSDADAAITAKEFANDSLDILDALIRVNEAKTPNSLKSALTALDNLENSLVEKYSVENDFGPISNDVDLTKVKDELLGDYITEIGNADEIAKNQRSDIQSIIVGVNNSYSKGLVDAVDNANDADTLLKALKDLKLDNVVDANKAQYNTDIDAFKSAADSNDVAKSLTDLQAQVDRSNVAAIAAADSADMLLAALKNAGVSNVVDANKAAYHTAAVNKDGVKYFANVTTKDDAQKVVNAVNAYVVANDATTATELRTALTTFAVALDNLGGVKEAPEFINLSSQVKLEVSEIVLNGKEADFTTAYTLGQAVDAAMEAHDTFLNNVNTSVSISTIKTALDNENVLPEFYALDAAAKVEKAEAVYNKLQELKAQDYNFKTIAEIKAAAGL